MAEDKQNAAEVAGAIEPQLTASRRSLDDHRRILVYWVVIPYVLCTISLFVAILIGLAPKDTVTLAASMLNPLAALAGGIVGFYFGSK